MVRFATSARHHLCAEYPQLGEGIEEEDQLEAVCRLVERFTVPLEGAGANPAEIHTEFVNMIQYASQYFSLATMDYRSVWWRIIRSCF